MSIVFKEKVIKFSDFRSMFITQNISENACDNLFLPYPTRIHCRATCKCKRIMENDSVLKIITNLDPQHEISYIIEKTWSDKQHMNFPKYIYIISDPAQNDLENIQTIYHDSLETRKTIFSHFSDYQWSREASIEMRSMVRNMISICFCHAELLVDQTTCNAGIALLGSKNNLNMIKYLFNKFVKKTEISELCICTLKDLKQFPQKETNHITYLFSCSQEVQKLDPNLCTLIGKESNTYYRRADDVNIHTFAFGKREWIPNAIETSTICARRELYEEFNIQVSKSILDFSQSINRPQHVYKPGNILYFVYLPSKIKITYHAESDTIYLSMHKEYLEI